MPSKANKLVRNDLVETFKIVNIFGVTMSLKIFLGDVRCLAMSPNECAHAYIWAF